MEVVVFYSAKHKKFEAAVEYPEEVCGWNFLSEIEGMFEQTLSILLYIGDPIRVGLCYVVERALLLHLCHVLFLVLYIHSTGFEVWQT